MTQDPNSVLSLDDEALGWGEPSAHAEQSAQSAQSAQPAQPAQTVSEPVPSKAKSAAAANNDPDSEPAMLLDTESIMTTLDATGCGFDFDGCSHKSNPFKKPPLGEDCSSVAKLVSQAFPTATQPVVNAITHYTTAYTLLHIVKDMRKRYEHNGKAFEDDEAELAVNVAMYARFCNLAAQKHGWSIARDNGNGTYDVRADQLTDDGLLIGTSNAPLNMNPDAMWRFQFTVKARKALLHHAPALKLALIEPNSDGGSTLPIEGASALSGCNWGLFCKELDTMHVLCTKACLWALKASCPKLPVPLSTATDSH